MKQSELRHLALDVAKARLGAGRVTRITSAMLVYLDGVGREAYRAAVERELDRALVQHKRSTRTLDVPVVGVPPSRRRGRA